MSHIEGDGVIEDIYYLLWRKDSPFNEKLNLRIPDTIVFRKGRPMAWYFTNNEGVVLRKKQTSLVYPEILSKFTKGASEGDIVAYFVNIDEEKKLGRLLDKSFFGLTEKPENKQNKDGPPSHDVEYFGLNEFNRIFSDYKNFEGKTGILQRFINPYSSHNELIQAIWSPRVCVFTKRVNLRRLNETRFDVYERALTFDGPDFYSKNVPLRGGYIPGKLRATCDNIVRHIAYISYEKVSIKRLVGYFKVDQSENVWFLWTSSIRINEVFMTSKVHKKLSQYVDKPLCLEPCLQTNANVRHIKSNFSSRPVALQMNNECTVCEKKVSKIALIPVIYRLLLGNEELLRRSEQIATQLRLLKLQKGKEDNESKNKTIRKATIGVPYFLKKLHPEMKLKDFQTLRENEHFLMMKAEVCEECYLLVSKEYEGGYPYNLTQLKKRMIMTAGNTMRQHFFSEGGANSSKVSFFRPEEVQDADDSNRAVDSIRVDKAGNKEPWEILEDKPSEQALPKVKFFNLDGETGYQTSNLSGGSTMYEPFNTNKSSSFPKFLNRTLWTQTAKNMKPNNMRESYCEDTKVDSLQMDHSNLKKEVMKAFSGTESVSSTHFRSLQSPNKTPTESSVIRFPGSHKPMKPRAIIKKNVHKKGRILKSNDNSQRIALKYKLDDVPDLFNDTEENSSEGEEGAEKKRTIKNNQPPASNPSPRGALKTKSSVRFATVENFDGPISKDDHGRMRLRGYLAELTTETKIQDHLDQDIVLTMANASQKNEDPVTSATRQQRMGNRSRSITSFTPFTQRMETQISGGHSNSPKHLTVRSNSAKNKQSKFNQQPIMSEKRIGKELDKEIENLLIKYSDENQRKEKEKEAKE